MVLTSDCGHPQPALLRSQDLEIGEFYVAQERGATDFKARRL